MVRQDLQKYKTAFTTIGIFVAGVGVLLPGYSYFTMYSPPFWEGAAILTSAIATFVIIFTFFYNPKVSDKPGQKIPALVVKSAIALIFSISFLIFYLGLFSYCTVQKPKTTERYQIGFGKMEWSLTEEGRSVKAAHPEESVEQWMLADALFRKDGPAVIWHKGAIILSGVLMVIVFLFTFVLWSFGWSLLAKQIARGGINAQKVTPGRSV